MATIEKLERAGKVIIDSITITSSDGKKTLDIYGLFNDIEMYEDIYSNSMFAKIRLVDGFNLKSTFPILGEEVITFVCHTPTIDTKITKRFAVVGISDFTISGAKKQVYTLDLITLEALIDLHSKVYRAYTGTPSDSALQVFNIHFSKITKASLLVDDSLNVMKIVAPTVSPFEFLSILANKAIGKDKSNSPNFLFFENNQRYNFLSLSTLFSQEPKTKFKWSYSQMRNRDELGQSTRDVNEEYRNVKMINVDKLFNTIDKSMAGSLGHKVIEVDVLRKTISKKTYSYTTNFNDNIHLNTHPTQSKTLYQSSNFDEVVDVSIIHSLHQNNINIDRDADILTRRIPMINHNEFIKLDITTHGRTDLKVGDVVEFEMGSFETVDSKDALIAETIDPYYSGKYLITSIHHKIRHEEDAKLIHETIIQIVKDSFPNAIGEQKK